MPPSKKAAAKTPAAGKKSAAKQLAVKPVIAKSKEIGAEKKAATATAGRPASAAARRAAAAAEQDDDFLKEAGPVLGPALMALMRDQSKPPFNNSFRQNGQWMVPPGGVANYPVCGADTDEATLERAFGMGDLYRLKFDGEWKLQIRKTLKRILPATSYGKICSRHHLQVGLHGNFTTYAIDKGEATEYEEEDLSVLHLERANLRASDWEVEADNGFGKTYY